MPSAGGEHTVMLRSDGQAAAFGGNPYGQCEVPALPAGVTYTQASAGENHTALLRSDGLVIAFGSNVFGQCNVPELPEGVECTQVSAGAYHTVLLRSDGMAVAFGRRKRHAAKRWRSRYVWKPQQHLPPAGVTYTHTSICGLRTIAHDY